MTNNRIIPITDHAGTHLLPADERYEPMPGSVVMTEGLHGTAWQRFFSDGLWHPTRGGRPRTWEDLLTRKNLTLIYDAEDREESSTRPRAQGAQWVTCTDPGCTFYGGNVNRQHKHVHTTPAPRFYCTTHECGACSGCKAKAAGVGS